jgi:hypothetical protein
VLRAFEVNQQSLKAKNTKRLVAVSNSNTDNAEEKIAAKKIG